MSQIPNFLHHFNGIPFHPVSHRIPSHCLLLPIHRITHVARKNSTRRKRFFLLLLLFDRCCSENPASEIFALRCRHQHCLSCWRMYLESNIVLNGCAQSISCPSRCIEVIDDKKILELLSTDENLRQRYGKLLVEAFVQTNRLTRWCPGKNCMMIIKMKSYARNCPHMIECDRCQTTSCFQCGGQWHEPIQCSLLEKWEKKNQDESMTGKWILASKRRLRRQTRLTNMCNSRYQGVSKMSFKYRKKWWL